MGGVSNSTAMIGRKTEKLRKLHDVGLVAIHGVKSQKCIHAVEDSEFPDVSSEYIKIRDSKYVLSTSRWASCSSSRQLCIHKLQPRLSMLNISCSSHTVETCCSQARPNINIPWSRCSLLQNLLGIFCMQFGIPTPTYIWVTEDAISQVCLAELSNVKPCYSCGKRVP